MTYTAKEWKREEICIHIYVYLLYFAVHLKLAQRCNPNSILIKIFLKKGKQVNSILAVKVPKRKISKRAKGQRRKIPPVLHILRKEFQSSSEIFFEWVFLNIELWINFLYEILYGRTQMNLQEYALNSTYKKEIHWISCGAVSWKSCVKSWGTNNNW